MNQLKMLSGRNPQNTRDEIEIGGRRKQNKIWKFYLDNYKNNN